MKYPIWKPILIVLVLAGCASLIAIKGLKPGIDLAGGTTLVYDVLVPENRNATEVINQTIAIQRDRVDSAGVKNLVWRAEAGNRLSVTMAQAAPVVKEKQEAFDAAEKALEATSLDAARVDRAVSIDDPAEREKQFAEIAKGSTQLQDKLKQLALLAQQRDAQQAPYEQAEQAWKDARAALGEEPSEDELAKVEALRNELIEATDNYSQARETFSELRSEVLANSISKTEIDRVLALSNTAKPGEAASPRAEAITALKAEFPGQALAIDHLVQAYGEYEAVKGPLDDPNDLIRMLRGAGVLEFRIAATVGQGRARPASTIAYEQRLDESGPRAGLSEDWRWFKVQDIEQFIDNAARRQELIDNEDLAPAVFAGMGLVGRAYGGEYYILLANTPGMAMTGAQDWSLTSVYRTQDSTGLPAVGFNVDGRGAGLLGELTGANVNFPMAIVLDGEVRSAPNLNDRLTTGGVISGRFSPAELNYLLKTLGAGSLEGQLSYDPISIKTTGPTLGKKNLEQGLRACVTALVVVAAFMAVYYLFAGLVADFALVANMVIILGVMSMIEATFTLPGIAGLVLTIGMAVDANVLIFERIREEMENKADLTTAIRQGFGKALSTILDANITTLITCVVLGYTATAEVKGFAVVLGVGILATLFTALFSTRVIIDLYMRVFKAKNLAMLPTLVPAVGKLLSPNVNWIALRRMFLPVSITLIVAGVSMVVYRGSDLLDIEFRSGTEVTFELAAGKLLTPAQVQERLDDFVGSDEAQKISSEAAERSGAEAVDWSLLEDARILTVGDIDEQGRASGFSVASLIEDSSAMSEAIRGSFRDVLDTTEAIDFAGLEQSIGQAKGVVEPITTESLYGSLERQFSETDPQVGAFVGGVAMVVEDMQPATSVEDLTERVSRMRRQPGYELLSGRTFQVFGLQRAPGNAVDEQGNALYAAAVVVSKDAETNYAEDASSFATNLEGLAATEWQLVKDALQRDTSLASVSSFSSQVSGTMKQQAIVAMALSLLAVVAYIWLRFGSLRYGLAAIVALVHDVCITLGILAICGWLVEIPGAHQALLLDDFKINLTLIAALLTIVGYSLNDTIVVFDRIRENRGRLSRATPAIINDSINQTVSRTMLTSGTTLIAVVVLYCLGGPGVHGFAFAMLIGILVGTYSSVAIAAPILLIGDKSEVKVVGDEKKPGASTPAPTSA